MSYQKLPAESQTVHTTQPAIFRPQEQAPPPYAVSYGAASPAPGYAPPGQKQVVYVAGGQPHHGEYQSKEEQEAAEAAALCAEFCAFCCCLACCVECCHG